MGEKILLVDDDAAIVDALRRILEVERYDILTFSDSTAAQHAIEQEEFSVLVSDNVMPVLSGMQLLVGAKAKWPTTRRVLLTGATGLDEAVAAFNDGAIHRYISKPWSKEELIQGIRAEVAAYRAEVKAREEKAMLEKTNKARTGKLIETMEELRQSRTQVALFEDAAKISQIDVPQRLQGLSFWVVDENEPVRNLLVSTLNQAGIHRCIGIPSPVDALWRARNGQEVHVVLSEWKMSPMDGLALVQRLREETTLAAKALFVLVTTREHRPMVEFALNSGVDGYVIKPFRLQGLLDHVDELISKGVAKQDHAAGILASCTCLVVNSQSGSGDQIQHLLHSAGIKSVATARTGQAGVRIIQQRKVDLVIWDLNVRDPDWRELGDRLGQEGRRPVLLVTSVLPTKEEIRMMENEPSVCFLPGPFRQADLLRTLFAAWKNEHENRGNIPGNAP